MSDKQVSFDLINEVLAPSEDNPDRTTVTMSAEDAWELGNLLMYASVQAN